MFPHEDNSLTKFRIWKERHIRMRKPYQLNGWAQNSYCSVPAGVRAHEPPHPIASTWSRCPTPLKELGTSRTHSAVIRCLTICQHIPVVRKNHKNQLTQQFDIICCLARCLALCIESKQIMSLMSCESATLKRGPQLCGQRCGPYLRH